MPVSCGEPPYTAVKLLEAGRGVIANLRLEVRSDISNLAVQHPELAKQFRDARDAINALLEQKPGLNDSEKFYLRSSRFEATLVSSRQLPEYENFLLDPSEGKLIRLAQDDSVVVFNISHIRSNAFLINPNGICCLPLPELNSNDLKTLDQTFQAHFNNLVFMSIVLKLIQTLLDSTTDVIDRSKFHH